MPASSFGVYWPALVPADEIDQVVVAADGTRTRIEPAPTGPPSDEPIVPPTIDAAPADIAVGHGRSASTSAPAPATRAATPTSASGPATTPATPGCATNLTPDTIRRLLPEAADLEVRVHELPNLRALNIVLVGYLGEGVASSTSFDPQAKGLGEYLRSRRAP